jgi:hypothetical protein
MVEPIPFYGLFDEKDSVEYLKDLIIAQERMIHQLKEELLSKDTGWEMIKNPDGSFTLRPFPAEE